MTPAQLARLEYLDSIEFPTPAEFAELRRLLSLQTHAHARATGQA
jgi:hypothetical protein